MRQPLALTPEVPMSSEIDTLFVDPAEPEREYYLPERLDLMVTGKCHMRCDGCWGPSHNAVTPEMTPEQWLKIVGFVDRNNRAERFNVSNLASDNATVCITGGEPLLYEQLPELATQLHEARVHTTLSTTGHDPHGLLPTVLSQIDELGVPIDGANADVHAQWRRGKLADGGLRTALDALSSAQEHTNLSLTVRTLLHPGNCTKLDAIPRLLFKNNIDPATINWKFYLFNPDTGPRHGIQRLRLTDDDLDVVAAQIPQLQACVKSLDILAPVVSQDRLVISHDGSAHIILKDSLQTTRDVQLGNIALAPYEVARKLNEEHALFLARACRRAGSFYYMQLVSEADNANFWDRIDTARQRYMANTMDLVQ